MGKAIPARQRGQPRPVSDVDITTWQELVTRAGSPGAARGWLREGRCWRVRRDAYAPIETTDGLGVRVAALRRVLPEGAVLSHRTALWLQGVPVLDEVAEDVVDVTVPRSRHLLPRRGLRPHSAALPDSDLCTVGGLVATTAARAVVDLARQEALAEAVAAGDAALRAGVTSMALLQESAERARGLRGVARVPVVLGHLEPRSESLMESRFRVRVVTGGLPRPEAQVDLYDDLGHVARVDLVLEGVLLEYDGREQRLERAVFRDDRRRQNRLLAAGGIVLRFTAADVYARSQVDLCRQLAAAIAGSRGRPEPALRRGRDTLRAPRLRPLASWADRA